MPHRSADIAVIGGGIVGLAHAYMALRKGHRVVLFERDAQAVGASVRNFGLLWPIGQQFGAGYEMAMRSREHWLEVAREAGLWINQNGSLHLAYHDDELDVLGEFVEMFNGMAPKPEILSPGQVILRSFSSNTHSLKGALWSPTECTVNPREAVRQIPHWLAETHGLILRFGMAVTSIEMPWVKSAAETWKVSGAFVCSGQDFETLYPQFLHKEKLTKCKLQMMKSSAPVRGFELGPTLCAGLTLRHYEAFRDCPSLPKVVRRYDEQNPKFREHGIHVLLAQNNYGELIIGDSHHLGATAEPFDSEEVNQLILEYLKTFACLERIEVKERWHGVYPKMIEGINFLEHPEPGVTIVNGLGGAGMTLSFGLAEDVINGL